MASSIDRWPLLLLALSTGAAAQTALPDYNSRGYCTSLAARTGARSQDDVNSCTETEAQKRAGLTPIWSSVPMTIREHCLRRGDRQSYDLLAICVETEMERTR
ncbi:MAG: hypothetical protein JWR00_4524 [Rubritepida sp.]|jgi:hypothetical protein|nr:hypothetical protein [Rubritepida sp.]